MTLSLGAATALIVLLLSGCTHHDAASAEVGIQSVTTSLAPNSCKQQADQSDPNESLYLVCPGVAGYSLIERTVDSGRATIDVVDPSQHASPLNFQDVVTPAMTGLAPQAEWRVQTKSGTQTPIALVVRAQAHEDSSDPAKVTRNIAAVAKIGAGRTCVVASIPDTGQNDAEIRNAVDSAGDQACLPPLKH